MVVYSYILLILFVASVCLNAYLIAKITTINQAMDLVYKAFRELIDAITTTPKP